jgi:Ca-activated chloride channel family protein
MFSNVDFAYPYVLWLLWLVPLMVYLHFKQGKKKLNKAVYSSLNPFRNYKGNWKEKFVDAPFWLRTIAIALLIIGLARPQTFSSGEDVYTEGIDIALVLDISSSMLAEDFKPNRLEAAKDISADFINGRTADRIGLIIFSKESFTQCPLTIDYNVLVNLLSDIKSGMIEDGTAIGNAVANGVNRLKDSEAKSKVIILLTDGVNNSGEIDPITAAQIAKTYGIKIYSIGVGAMGEAPYPVMTPFGKTYQRVPVEIDEKILTQISDITGGKYFRAASNSKLKDIYKEIDRMEKIKIEVSSYRSATELFYGWIGAALALLFLELVLSKTLFKKIP